MSSANWIAPSSGITRRTSKIQTQFDRRCRPPEILAARANRTNETLADLSVVEKDAIVELQHWKPRFESCLSSAYARLLPMLAGIERHGARVRHEP